MDQRTQFIADYLRDSLAITELCEHYGISRKTGYKWIERYLRQGPAGLEEHSRRPRCSPNQTAEEIVTAILDARRRHPSWGGKKLLALLHKRHPQWLLPGRSTACDILSRHGMVPTRRQRCQRPPYSEPPGSGKLSHSGSPILSQAGSPILSHPGAAIESHPVRRDRIPSSFSPSPEILREHTTLQEVTSGGTEESGDRHP